METNIHFAVFLCRQRIILFIRLSLRFFLYFVQTEIKKLSFLYRIPTYFKNNIDIRHQYSYNSKRLNYNY